MAKKLSTKDILAAARKQDSGGQEGAPSGESGADAAQSEAPPDTESPAASAGGETGEQPKPATTKSTKDILAAARAQAGSGKSADSPKPESKPAASAGAAPKSTKDILAAARAQAKPGGAKPAGTPKSTKDILAAARAQSSGGPKTDKPAPASAKTSAKPGASTKPAGERPSVQEMLRAVREGEPGKPGAAAGAGAQKPRLPAKPPAARKAKAAEATKRRSVIVALFATPFALAWTLFTASSAIATLALARFMMPNVLVEPPTKFKVGSPTDYPNGTVATKFKSEFGVWIVHSVVFGKNVIYALSTVCTHLGCTPNWLESEQKFKCPCHGSGFYITGVNFEGPAPRPLERYAIHIAPDGMLEVDKSAKFQQELGQWDDPASYVEMA